jgi:hypothetical protein
MAICPPNKAINRILAALGLENVRSLKINAAVNDVVTVVTEQYATGTQLDDLATALETKEWVLVPKDAGRWIPVTERMPPPGFGVLIFFRATDGDGTPSCIGCDGNGGLMTVAAMDRIDGQCLWTSEYGDETPSHWMPLPAPPADCTETVEK